LILSRKAQERMSDRSVHTEEHRVRGERLVARIRELVHQGNIRRIIVKDDRGRTLIEIPLTLGVVGAVLLPVWVALGAMAALAADFNLVVEKAAQPTDVTVVEPAGGAAAK
jgi:Domain of unknown function (DUF4342)